MAGLSQHVDHLEMPVNEPCLEEICRLIFGESLDKTEILCWDAVLNGGHPNY